MRTGSALFVINDAGMGGRMAKCSNCGGSGEATCNECYGSGKRYDGKPCNYCKGKKRGRCWKCHGSGKS